MNKTERKWAWLKDDPDVKLCIRCRHFVVHYVHYAKVDRYVEVDSGHCCFPRLKLRMKYDICEHFERDAHAPQS